LNIFTVCKSCAKSEVDCTGKKKEEKEEERRDDREVGWKED
jgi:hypothetical protein